MAQTEVRCERVFAHLRAFKMIRIPQGCIHAAQEARRYYRLATNQLSKNYKPFLWRRLRAKLVAAGLLNCTENVPKYRNSDSVRRETQIFLRAGVPLLMSDDTGAAVSLHFLKPDLNEAGRAADAAREV
jgi:hypothetical protein